MVMQALRIVLASDGPEWFAVLAASIGDDVA